MNRKRARHRWGILPRIRKIDPYLILFSAVCGVLLAGGIIGILTTHSIQLIG